MKHLRLILFLLPVLAYPALSKYVVLEYQGAIGPVSDRYISNGIDRAQEKLALNLKLALNVFLRYVPARRIREHLTSESSHLIFFRLEGVDKSSRNHIFTLYMWLSVFNRRFC